MNPPSDASRSALVQVTLLGPQSLDEEPACPHCSQVLERHQPDAQRFETMLGTCSECGDWFVLVHDPELNQMWLTHLPLNQLRVGPIPVGGAAATPRKPGRRTRRRGTELRAG